jgi:hypothetical protein
MKLKLVENWKKLRYAISVWMMVLCKATLATWALMPDKLQDSLPHGFLPSLAAGFLFCGIVGRFIQQDKVSGE